MTCLGTYQDTNTGTNFNNRPELDKAKKLCMSVSGEVDYILAYKQDRFGRDTLGALLIMEDFRKIGVEVNFTDEWIDFDDSGHPMMLLLKF